MQRHGSSSTREEKQESRRRASDARKLKKMGDWAKEGNLEWDATDVNFSTDDGLEWLQSLGLVSKSAKVADLNETQQGAMKSLLVKLEKRQEISGENYKELTVEDIHADASLFGDVDKVCQVIPPSPAKLKSQNSSPSKPTNDTTMTHVELQERVNRLGLAWAHAQEEENANTKLDREISDMLLMSRDRMQVELIALRRENAALRKGVQVDTLRQPLEEQAAFIVQLQQLLDQRESEIYRMSEELFKKNEELSVLRTVRDLSATNAMEAPRMSLGELRQQYTESKQGSFVNLLQHRDHIDDVLTSRSVPQRGRSNMWDQVSRAADERRRIPVGIADSGMDDTPLASKFVI